MTKKEMYLEDRLKGFSDHEIALRFGVKECTITRAIGSNKNDVNEVVKMNNTAITTTEITADGDAVLRTIVVNCCDCGATFSITPSEQRFYNSKEGFHLPRRCPRCRKKKNSTETHVCTDCGAEFELRVSEKEFYTKNGLEIPVRCKPCRVLKRKYNEEASALAAEETETEEEEIHTAVSYFIDEDGDFCTDMGTSFWSFPTFDELKKELEEYHGGTCTFELIPVPPEYSENISDDDLDDLVDMV